MANEVKVILTGDSSQVIGATQKLERETESVVGKIKKHWLGLSAAIAGAMLTASKAWDIASQSAQFEQSSNAFRSMVKNMGADAEEEFNKIKKASAGLIDNRSLTESANKALSLGIPLEKLADLMEIARAKSRDMGITTTQAFNDIATGIGRGSPLILDNLGLMLKIGAANEKMATTLGKTVEQLTAQEQKMAILNATLEAGKEALDRYDLSQLTTYEHMQKLTATVENLKLTMGTALIRVFAGAIGSLQWLAAGALNATGALFKLISAGEALTDYLGITDKTTSKFNDMANSAFLAAEELAGEAADNFAAMVSSSKDLDIAMRKQGNTIEDTKSKSDEAAAAARKLADEYANLKLQLERKLAMTGLDEMDQKLLQISNDFDDMRKKVGAEKAQIIFDLQLQIINKEEFDKSLKAIKGAYESLEKDFIPSEEDRQKALDEYEEIVRNELEFRKTLEEDITDVTGTELEKQLAGVKDHYEQLRDLARESLTDREELEKALTQITANETAKRAQIEEQYREKTFGEGMQKGAEDYLKAIEFSYERGKEIALDNIHAVDDALMTAFDDPKKGLDDLFDYFKFTLKKMIVEALASKITIPIATAITGGQAGIQGALSGGNILGGLGSILGAGGLGLPAAAAGGIGSILGGNTGTGAMLGGLAGSVLLTGAGTAGYGLIGGSLMSGIMGGGSGIIGGALAGSVVPIIGTLIGAAVGALAGSLFGGKEDPHDLQLRYGGERGDTWQSKFGDTDWGVRQWDEIGVQSTKAILTVMDKVRDGFIDFFEETGRDINILDQEWTSSKIKLKEGMKMEDIVKQLVGQYAKFAMPDINFKEFQKSGEELSDTIIRIIDAFSAIDDIRDSVDDFIGAVQGAPDVVAQLRDSIIDANADLKDLKDSIDDMADPADRIAALNDLKVATYNLAQEQIQMIKGMQDSIANLQIGKADFALSMAEKISSLLGTAMADISIPTDAMDIAKRRMEEAGTASGKLGYLQQYIGYLDKWVDQNLSAIEQKYATEKQLLEDQVAVIQKWKSVQQSVSSQISGMKLSTDNPQDVLARLGIAQGEMERLGSLYAGAAGEQKAGLASDYQQSINDWVALAQEAYQRPSSAYRAIYDKAIGLLEQIQTDAAAAGTDDTTLLARIEAIDIDMAADIKSFKESAAGYYQWAQSQGSLYDEAIAESLAQLVAITGDKTPEEKIAELQQNAVTELEGIKAALDQIHIDFTAWQQNPNTADIGDIKDILGSGSNPFQKGTSEAGWWQEWNGKDVSIEQATAFLEDIMDDLTSPFKKAKKSWNEWFNQFADIPGFAEGATVNSPTLAVIGERKREHVLDEDKLVQIVKSAGSGGGSYVVNINIYADKNANAKEVAQEARREFANFLKYDREAGEIIKNRGKS